MTESVLRDGFSVRVALIGPNNVTIEETNIKDISQAELDGLIDWLKSL